MHGWNAKRVVLAVLFLMPGCYLSHELDDTCPAPEEPLAIDREVVVGGWDGSPARGCTVEGQEPDGTRWSVACTATGCELSIDGDLICRDTTVDFANTCSNGVPGSLAFRLFDYSSFDPSVIERR